MFGHFVEIGSEEVRAEEFGLDGGGIADAVADGLGVVTFAGTGECGESAGIGEAFFAGRDDFDDAIVLTLEAHHVGALRDPGFQFVFFAGECFLSANFEELGVEDRSIDQ